MKKIFESLVYKKIPEDVGEIYIDWNVPQYEEYARSKTWYILAMIVGVGLLTIAVLTFNYLLAVIIFILAIILFVQHYQTPQKIIVKLTDSGVIVGKSFYSYDDFSGFWFVYSPPEIKEVYFGFKKGLKRHLDIPLGDINPLLVKEILVKFVEENLVNNNESIEARISRKIKL
ncbi:hypothetical protein A2533_04145 [Candidatus Falkowbacteria bacterium RIFOXYD2_FULL_35_9]|uniref:DUF5673 domain-containing protein n=1 Tax=Candidatus Falkowbacteria bacterium RIFOXYC2_FULL_36_12 TaxID=1798002 RepID=A0A1F5T0S5_9BACT|nr:MAG: hypothetical protein A2300_00565 [Candidatus Falkowbacteria bacterium RIFOXYB2_FULL_35_7]OGF32509.1 MAG: hypothetical protein A2478_02650 [Candidatus Falkowbacteria bacterium RIFOXYC2_FULL_36_12]OGF34578.1 MAG: hypothetical protein A2223_04265 [Candidatus Falkowbacteria bacterium RIFOXYA2_FULL_35_8]OGF48534.1 MAG: hypothetical protein A2533_04145 [Candidatus Falkowbacteria bacterium RIFOXYD2_FULL_35_9]